MYISLCFNPSIDNAIYLDEILTLKTNRVRKNILSAGGKGINIARAFKLFGDECKVFGFSGGRLGDLLEDYLDGEGIDYNFVRTEAETRMNLKLIEEHRENRLTEINAPGGPIEATEVTALEEKLEEILEKLPENENNYLFLSGSFPQGVENSVYNSIISSTKNKNVRCVVDCSRTALELAIPARPYLIKPNKAELEILAKREFSTDGELKEYLIKLFDNFGTRILYTRGAKGAIYVGPEGVYSVSALTVNGKNPVGAGDMAQAAFIHMYEKRGDLSESLRFAMAASAATAETEGSDMPSLSRVEELFGIAQAPIAE